MEAKELQKSEPTEIACGNNPADMIRVAVGKGANLADLNAALDLQMKWEANEARKAFNKSFAAVQEGIRAVARSSANPQTHSKYANLEGIIETTRPVYTREGFSVIFYEGETPRPEHVRICADVLHKLGHKETFYYDVPLDGIGIKGNANMTKIHGKASSTSYARRYLMCMIWNIPTQDDDDGNAASKIKVDEEFITEAQAIQIKEYISSTGSDSAKFLKYLGVESVEEITKSQFSKAMNALKLKEKKK